MTRVVGRGALLSQVAALLREGESVALHGPTGVGKSALLDAIEQAATARGGVTVLRAAGAADEHALPWAALRDVLGQVPAAVRHTLPAAQRDLVEGGLVGLAATAQSQADLAAVLLGLLSTWSEQTPVLLLLDDVQLLDAASSVVIGYARRRLGGRFALVATLGAWEEFDGDAVDVSGLRHLEVPPLAATDMLDLLGEHGLAPDVAQRVHVESGGLPATALALAGALGRRPSVLGSPTPVPDSTARVLRDRFLAQQAEVRETLVTAALLHRPAVRLLARAGRLAAEEHVRRAVAAGLLAQSGDVLRFTPSVLRAVVVDATPTAERLERHRALADVAATESERLRHLALADPRPDAALAEDLAAAAEESERAGLRALAAELWLLAADHAPARLARRRPAWLTRAVETAAYGNHRDLVSRALRDVWEAGPSPDEAVRVRLAVPELAGGAAAMLDEVLTQALSDAGDDDRLVARVLLQRARIALRESRPGSSARDAESAVRLLERVGDDEELALGLTTLAVARRWLGGDHRACLDRAVALAGPAPTGLVHVSPGYMAARFALYDDRLEEAWARFLSLLGRVERGAANDQVHVLRCLVEVGVRRGLCREALDHAARASSVGEESDLDAHASWFITGLAELAGGRLERARTLAEHGARAAEDVGDTRYLIRHLGVLGQALLRSGEAAAARASLVRIRDLERARGISDPTVNRWHADLVSAEVLLGRLDDAATTLADARREVARRTGSAGVSATLDRAEAELLVARGDAAAAEPLLDRAAEVLRDLGMPIERGRVLVARAHLERRRRRVAASRTALQQALDLFSDLRADAWVDQVRAELEPAPGQVQRQGTADDLHGRLGRLGRLNETENRIAREVATGASNREIAERTYLSVKTVEATLTRIYRKLDVRSRTHLAALLRPAPPPPARPADPSRRPR